DQATALHAAQEGAKRGGRRGVGGVRGASGRHEGRARAPAHHSGRGGPHRYLTGRTFPVPRSSQDRFRARKVVHSSHRNVTTAGFTPTWSIASLMFHGQVVELIRIS